MMYKVFTAPTNEPLSLGEAKDHLKVTDNNSDTKINLLIKTARRLTEEFLNRPLITQTWDLWLDGFPSNGRAEFWEGIREGALSSLKKTDSFIEIRKVPLQSVSFVKTYNENDVVSTFSATNYLVDTFSEPARVGLNFGATWPTALRPFNAVNVQFIAGYGDDSTSIPEDIKTGMLLTIANLFENRGDKEVRNFGTASKSEGFSKIPELARSILMQYQLVRL